MTVWANWRAWLLAALVFTAAGTGFGRSVDLDPPDVVPVGVFSEMDPSRVLPVEWQPLTLAAAYEKTEYDLVQSDRGTVLRARSDGSASGLLKENRIDLGTHPILEWRWKVSRIFEEGTARNISRNDLPARLIVTFDYRDLSLANRFKAVAIRALGYDVVPKRALIYFWANQVERHTVLDNTQASWFKMVAVQTGTTHVGTWQTERRNVRNDYRRIFGEEPPPVEQIALLTDANDIEDSVTAYYGDIVFRRATPDSTAVDTTLHIANDASGNQ